MTLSTTSRVGRSALFDGAGYLRIPALPDSYWAGTYTVVRVTYDKTSCLQHHRLSGCASRSWARRPPTPSSDTDRVGTDCIILLMLSCNGMSQLRATRACTLWKVAQASTWYVVLCLFHSPPPYSVSELLWQRPSLSACIPSQPLVPHRHVVCASTCAVRFIDVSQTQQRCEACVHQRRAGCVSHQCCVQRFVCGSSPSACI